MILKKGVVLTGLQYEMRPVMKLYQDACDYVGGVAVITSGLDGVHSAGSYHYYGYALDLGIVGMESFVDEIVDSLRGKLGSLYDVIKEPNHIHVEFDVERAKLVGYRKEF